MKALNKLLNLLKNLLLIFQDKCLNKKKVIDGIVQKDVKAIQDPIIKKTNAKLIDNLTQVRNLDDNKKKKKIEYFI